MYSLLYLSKLKEHLLVIGVCVQTKEASTSTFSCLVLNWLNSNFSWIHTIFIPSLNVLPIIHLSILISAMPIFGTCYILFIEHPMGTKYSGSRTTHKIQPPSRRMIDHKYWKPSLKVSLRTSILAFNPYLLSSTRTILSANIIHHAVRYLKTLLCGEDIL